MAGPILYSYQGNDFSSVWGAYSTNESISGTFTVYGPTGNIPADNNGLPTMSPIWYSFTDDNETLNPTNSYIQTFDVGTDANGDISYWFIDIVENNTTNDFITTQFPDNLSTSVDFGGVNTSPSPGYGINSEEPGVWTMTGVQSPEPTPALLTSAALLALAFVARGMNLRGQGRQIKPTSR
jgi:hypothetical protein